MRHQRARDLHQFFMTPPMPCPYLPGRLERRLVTELSGPDVKQFHDTLSLNGFRRSHSIAYAPNCPDCQACLPIRIVADEFQPGRTHRRIETANAHLIAQICHPTATPEQYDLFFRYQHDRHRDGEMSRMDFEDYQALIEETPLDTMIIEFRTTDGVLRAVCLMDNVCDGLSAVYSFFDPDMEKSSLGTFMVLWLIRRAQKMKLPYVYLGFWIKNAGKMAYKSNFQPGEVFRSSAWVRLESPRSP